MCSRTEEEMEIEMGECGFDDAGQEIEKKSTAPQFVPSSVSPVLWFLLMHES